MRHPPRDRDHDIARQNAERRDVAFAREAVAPRVDFTERGELAGIQIADVLEPEIRIRILGREAGRAAQAELFLGPMEAIGLAQGFGEPVAQHEQVPGVRRRVLEQLDRQRPLRPVGALVLLVEPDVEIPGREGSESDRGLAEQLCGELGIEQSRDVDVVVARQKPQVELGVVDDDLALRLRERPSHEAEVEGERIDHVRPAARRDLHEAYAIGVPVVACGFRIDRQHHRRFEFTQRSAVLFFTRYVEHAT